MTIRCVTCRRVFGPAAWGLRAYPGTAALLAATAALALVALLPVTSVVGPHLAPRLELPAWRGDLGIVWTPLAWSPTATRHGALLLLFQLLLGVAAGVLAVAALTILSLSAARAALREGEVAVRRAVGASRRHLALSALVEGAAIGLGALAVAGIAGTAAARLALGAWPGDVGPASRAAGVGAAALAIGAIVLGVVLPVAPRRRTQPLAASAGRPLTLFVPALQLGLGLTVLTGAALLERRAASHTASPRGALPAGQVFEVTAPGSPSADRAAGYGSLLHRLKARLRGPVSLTSPGTLVGMGMVDVVTTDCGACSQGGLAYPLHPVAVTHYLVSADTFGVLGLAVVAGRGITDADRRGAPLVAVVSRSLATHHFQQGRPVGRKILVGGIHPDWYTVVGVVPDRQPVGFGAGLEPTDAVYLSVLQHAAPTVDLFVGGPADSAGLAGVERTVRDTAGPKATVRRISAAALIAAELAPVRWFGDMMRTEGWVILVIAALGTFVVMHLWVASWRYELGVRRAVGARRRHVVAFVVARAMGVALGGVAVGLWVGLVAWGTLAAVVAGLPPWDASAALRFAPLLAGAALGGALLPAWRAARATPLGLIGEAAS